MPKYSWVSSSFDDFQTVSANSMPASARPSSSQCGKRPKTVSNIAVALHSDELWVNKYAPGNVEDVAVNKKKVAELHEWFEKSLSSCHTRCKVAPILLLTGPSGVGKSVTVHLVAAELHAELKEWTNKSVDQFTSTENTNVLDSESGYESQTSKFSSFLFRANRYPSLDLSGHAAVTRQHIVVIEEIPNVFTCNAPSLHDMLRRYRSYSLSPLVFVISDRIGTSIDYSLFPKALQAELGIDTINFNPIAPTMVMKVLTKIVKAESVCSVNANTNARMPDKDTLELLVESNRGDIRAAINALQFYCRNISAVEKHVAEVFSAALKAPRKNSSKTSSRLSKPSSRTSQVTVKKSSKEKQEACEVAGVCGRDGMLSLFHAVGKILHCKRELTGDGLLPLHLEHCQRGPLLVDPEDVASRVFVNNEHFIAFLHQNYIDFHPELSEVVLASTYLSDADELVSDWASRTVLADYGLSVATRGLLFSSTSSSTAAVGWKPLHKAQWFHVAKLARNNYAAAQDLFATYHLPPVDLHTELLPYLAICNNILQLNRAQALFVHDIGQLSTRHLDSKMHLERLDENEFINATVTDDMLQSLPQVYVPVDQLVNSVAVADAINSNFLPIPIDLDDTDIVIDEFDD